MLGLLPVPSPPTAQHIASSITREQERRPIRPVNSPDEIVSDEELQCQED